MGKIGSILVLMVMVAASMLLLIGDDGIAENTGVKTRGGLDDPLSIDLNSFTSTKRPGETEDFYIRVYNDYNGSAYGGPFITNSTTLHSVKLSISGFYDGEGMPLAISPVNWIEGNIYNNNGDGYDIDRFNARNFYTDASNNYLEFQIKMDDIVPGTYHIGIMADFRVLVDWDGGTDYTYIPSSFEVKIEFTIESHLKGSGYPSYNFRTYQESMSTDNLYSGAMNKIIGIYGLYSATDPITDIYATISFPDSGIMAVEPSTFSSSLPSTITWRINVPEDIPPGKYQVELMLTYTVDGMEITEGATIQALVVEYTPLLMPPPFDDLSSPYRSYSRSNLPSSIDVTFSNVGNVELQDIIVHLDLDNTDYIYGGNYYINEDFSGNIYQEGVEETIESVPVGGSRTVTFETLEFLPRLPPGKYRIPIDYIATYYNNGSTGDSSGLRTVGHWTSKGYYDHRNILWDRDYPEDKNSERQPYLLIEILPEPDGPMIMSYVDSGYNEPPGTINDRFRLRVENFEMYDFHNLMYTIHTDDGSPFLRPFTNENDTENNTLEPVLRTNLYDSNSDSFYFYASIRKDAPPGLNYFKVDVEGYTEFGIPFSKTMVAYIQVASLQPRFQPISVEVGDILADRTVEVTVEILNVGLGGAINLTCYFVSSSSGFVSTELPMEIGTVMAGERFFFTFRVKPESERRYFNGNYYGYVYFSYYDEMGEFDELMSGNHMQVRYDIYDKLPDIRVLKVDAPLVDRGDEFDVTVTIMNVGGSTASNVRVLLPYNSAQFTVVNEELTLEDLAAGESQSFTFSIEALKEISDSSTYSFTMYFSYTDITNRERTFSEGESESFSIRTKDRIVPSEQRQIVEDDGALVADGTGNVILGILILFAAIIFGGIIAGVIRETFGQKKEVKKPERSKGPKKAKKIELEEEPEEEEEEHEEEEEDMEDEEEEEDEMDW